MVNPSEGDGVKTSFPGSLKHAGFVGDSKIVGKWSHEEETEIFS